MIDVTKKYITRDGSVVSELRGTKLFLFVFRGKVENKFGGENYFTWRQDGSFIHPDTPHDLDLVEVSEGDYIKAKEQLKPISFVEELAVCVALILMVCFGVFIAHVLLNVAFNFLG